MTAWLCRRFESCLSLLFAMRQSRLLGERRAKATMVSRLSAQPSGHWEKLSRRAIFPNVDRSALSSFRKEFFTPLRNASKPTVGITDAKKGLRCSLCNSPTNSILSYLYVCQHCQFTKEAMYPNNITSEDPTYCNYCNP